MSNLDVQLFREDGTWIKPPGAVTVDVILAGTDAGGYQTGHGVAASGKSSDLLFRRGEISAVVLRADELPDQMPVTVGAAGRGTGGSGSSPGLLTFSRSAPPRDGLAVIITHLAPA
jgi:hypothetical protein